MSKHVEISMPRKGRGHSFRVVATLIAFLGFVPGGDALAENSTHRLQGLFCNTEKQVNETLGYMRRVSPRAAVERTNNSAIVCTFVDLLHYVVEHPVVIEEIGGSFPLFKYEGSLVGVEVGGAIRPVTPPVNVFFVMPEKLVDAPLEGRA